MARVAVRRRARRLFPTGRSGSGGWESISAGCGLHNGRMARAIADMSLARSEGSPRRFYSMSTEIRDERGEYYRILEQTQRGTMDVTAWMEWFLGCLTRAIAGAQAALSGVIDKARYWETLRDMPLNDRQRLVVSRLLEGF